jgi:hypothetical protein
VAFGMGLFSGKGNLGPGRHQAFAVTSESRKIDKKLRFFESCDNYKVFYVGHFVFWDFKDSHTRSTIKRDIQF